MATGVSDESWILLPGLLLHVYPCTGSWFGAWGTDWVHGCRRGGKRKGNGCGFIKCLSFKTLCPRNSNQEQTCAKGSTSAASHLLQPQSHAGYPPGAACPCLSYPGGHFGVWGSAHLSQQLEQATRTAPRTQRGGSDCLRHLDGRPLKLGEVWLHQARGEAPEVKI